MDYEVALIICKSDHTWSIETIEVDEDEIRHWEEETIESVAIKKWTDDYVKNTEKLEEITHIGVYNIEERENEN